MSKLSEQVQNQIRVSEKVVASARTHVDTIAAALAEQAKKVQGPETKATFVAFKAVVLALADTLDADTLALRDAEQTLATERADDGPVRAARDSATSEVAGLLSLLRATIAEHLGAAAVATYGLQGETPRVPAKLVQHAKNVVQLLAEFPANAVSPFGSSFNTELASQALGAKVGALASHIHDDDREARELETAITGRDRAASRWTETYQGTATALEGLYRQAGWKELADKVRPTQRKLRGDDAGAEIEAGTSSEGAAGG